MKTYKLEKKSIWEKVETATIQAENDDVYDEYIRGKREIDWQTKENKEVAYDMRENIDGYWRSCRSKYSNEHAKDIDWKKDLDLRNLEFHGYVETCARHSKHGLEKVRDELEKDGLLVKEVVLVKGLPPSAVIPILSTHAYWTEEESSEYSRQMKDKDNPTTLSPPSVW
jgi:hypothetical protein